MTELSLRIQAMTTEMERVRAEAAAAVRAERKKTKEAREEAAAAVLAERMKTKEAREDERDGERERKRLEKYLARSQKDHALDEEFWRGALEREREMNKQLLWERRELFIFNPARSDFARSGGPWT